MNVSLRKGTSPTANVVTLGSTSFVFSYETVVAYRTPDTSGWVVSENVWGITTGKHMNQETGTTKADRVPRAEFLVGLEDIFSTL